MNLRTLFLLATAMTASTFVPSAQADTYVAYHCHCTAERGASCSCSYDFELGKSQTKEFRGYCDEMMEPNGYPIRPDVTVSGRDSGTSCTIQVTGFPETYTSKSCTNWDPFSRDHVSIKTTCTNK